LRANDCSSGGVGWLALRQNGAMSEREPDAMYQELVEQFESDPDVSAPSSDVGRSRGFGANALKVDGRIFAMLTNERLVVKLPRVRVEDLVASGVGMRFDPGHGRIMREWLSVHPDNEDQWEALAREALTFGRRPG
jgi:hypothetical protein